MDDELVMIYGAESALDALLHRELLEEAGIDVMEDVRASEVYVGVLPDLYHSVLYVRAGDADRARELLEAYAVKEDSGELADEIPDTDTDTDTDTPA